MTVILEKPTAEAVAAAGEAFDKENRLIERALNELFTQFPKNTDTAHVLLKVIALNELYSTQIPLYSKSIPSVWELVHHIVELKIDPALDLGSLDLVYNIAKTESRGKIRFNYSFATKYCSWHRPDFYPIYDWHVDEYLWEIKNRGWIGRFKRQELKIYARVKEIVSEFRDRYDLGNFNFKQIDKFMYYEGGKLLTAKEDERPPATTTESQ